MTKNLEKKYQNWDKERRYELLNYDKRRHFELLTQQGYEFKLQLQIYSNILIDQLNWEIRDQYLELLEDYMEKKIDSFNFRIKFCERYESIGKIANQLQSNLVFISPDENSLDFGDLLSRIESCCKAYSDDAEPFRSKFEIGDLEFQTSIKKIYLEIQNFLENK